MPRPVRTVTDPCPDPPTRAMTTMTKTTKTTMTTTTTIIIRRSPLQPRAQGHSNTIWLPRSDLGQGLTKPATDELIWTNMCDIHEVKMLKKAHPLSNDRGDFFEIFCTPHMFRARIRVRVRG
eukprot:8259887-Pyramimonas_sp.AAC.1